MTADLSINKLVLITAAVVTLLVLSVGIYQFSNASKDPRIDSLCKVEINKANLATKLSDSDKTKARCERNEELELSLSRDRNVAEAELSRFISREFDRCFKRMGSGKLTPFPGELVSQQTHCYVCRPFSFSSNGDWDTLVVATSDMDPNDGFPISTEFKQYSQNNGIDLFQTMLDQKAIYMTDLEYVNGLFKDKTKVDAVDFIPEKDTDYYIVNGFISIEEINIFMPFINKFEVASYMYVVKKENLIDTCAVVEN